MCYLDTEADGKVIALYEKVGYVKVGECKIDLQVCGLEGIYTHVAMIREPVSAPNITGTAREGTSQTGAAKEQTINTTVSEQAANREIELLR